MSERDGTWSYPTQCWVNLNDGPKIGPIRTFRDVTKVEQKFFPKYPSRFLKSHHVPGQVPELSKTMLNFKLFGTFCAILEKIESLGGTTAEVQSGPYSLLHISEVVGDGGKVSTRAV